MQRMFCSTIVVFVTLSLTQGYPRKSSSPPSNQRNTMNFQHNGVFYNSIIDLLQRFYETTDPVDRTLDYLPNDQPKDYLPKSTRTNLEFREKSTISPTNYGVSTNVIQNDISLSHFDTISRSVNSAAFGYIDVSDISGGTIDDVKSNEVEDSIAYKLDFDNDSNNEHRINNDNEYSANVNANVNKNANYNDIPKSIEFSDFDNLRPKDIEYTPNVDMASSDFLGVSVFIDSKPSTHRDKFRNIQEYEEARYASILSFQNSLGYGTQLIKDDRGSIIGVSKNDIIQPEAVYRAPEKDSWNQLESNRESRTVGDQDQCCETLEVFFFNSTLTDVYGRRRTIMQFRHSNSYQFIRHGLCGTQGSCGGVCGEKYVNMALAIHPPDRGELVTFKFFQIPGYCACRNYHS